MQLGFTIPRNVHKTTSIGENAMQKKFSKLLNEQLIWKKDGIFKAACNGDAASLELFHLPTMKLFSGKLVVLVQSTMKAGEIELTVSGKGLKTSKTVINTIE